MSEQNEMVFSPIQTDIHSVFQELNDFFSDTAQFSEISLSFHVQEACSVYTDRNMLLTILRNLISNALKFSPNDKNIFPVLYSIKEPLD